MTSLTLKQTFSTKSEMAYWALRKAIVTGEFADWAPLDEVELMARFNMGRTPIREAIRQLASEEFVVWHPRRTPHARTTSAEDLAPLFEARHIFEVPAARLATERATTADLALMERIVDQIDIAIAEDRLYDVADSITTFTWPWQRPVIIGSSLNQSTTSITGPFVCGTAHISAWGSNASTTITTSSLRQFAAATWNSQYLSHKHTSNSPTRDNYGSLGLSPISASKTTAPHSCQNRGSQSKAVLRKTTPALELRRLQR